MMKEIGGYLELETFSGKGYYPELYKLNLGRTALKLLIRIRRYKKIYLPYFVCDSVTGACEDEGCELIFYHLSPEYKVVLDKEGMAEDEVLLLLNHYGQLDDETILACKAKYGNIIVDNTHDFFRRPLPGVDTLYSVRKYFGVCDGAYLATDAEFDIEAYEQDTSWDRMEHVLGRYDADAGTFYQKMLDNAHSYYGAPVKRMSRLTDNLLNGIDYEAAKERRNENYAVLKELLGDENTFTKITPDGPFVYPFHNENGAELRKRLAAKKIFVPTYWSNVIKDRPWTEPEHAWAENILPLPVDQRYSKEDMEYLASVVKEEIKA